MITNGTFTGWAQSGEIFFPDIKNGCWRHFAQQQENSKYYLPRTNYGSCVSAGEEHRAWQQSIYIGGSQGWAIRSNIDTTIFLQSPWDQFVAWGNNYDWVPEYEGEAHYDCSTPTTPPCSPSNGWSDIPGTGSAPVPFGNMEVQDYYGDGWYDTCGFVHLYPYADTHYSYNAPQCDYVNVWTSQT